MRVKNTQGVIWSSPVASERCGITRWYASSSKKVGGIVAHSQATSQADPMTRPPAASVRSQPNGRNGNRVCLTSQSPTANSGRAATPAIQSTPQSALATAIRERQAMPEPMRTANSSTGERVD